MPNGNGDKGKDKNSEPDLKGQDVYTLLYILLKLNGGSISLPHRMFEEAPDGLEVKRQYDPVNKRWFFTIPRPKRKRGIVRPPQRLIVPN